jgi:hypothetical protein
MTTPTPGPVSPVSALIDAQGILQPGEPGYWQIWGANITHAEEGDLLLVRWEDKETPPNVTIGEYIIASIDPDPPWCPVITAASTTDPPYPPNGERFRVGMGQRITLLRQGTHNTLAR